MSELKTFTIQDIRSWKPCYDPARHLPEGWGGTALDILKNDEIRPQDRLWVVLREEVLDEKTLRLFAVWCARSVEHFLTDERSKKAIEVADRYAHGTATKEELEVAGEEAREAARVAGEEAWATGAAAWAAAAADATAAADAAEAAQLIKMLDHGDE